MGRRFHEISFIFLWIFHNKILYKQSLLAQDSSIFTIYSCLRRVQNNI